MTYNVHSCIGMDGRRSPERVARLIARYHPDVVALQELDVGRARTGGIDQAEAIAQALSMTYHFHPTIHVEEERYGDAVLSHLPMRLVKAGMLPGLRHRPRLEPRGAVWVAVEVAGREVQVINTHLGLWPEERRHQIVALTGDGWLGHDDCREPIVLCGDFNAGPRSFTYRTATRTLRDAQTAAHGSAPANTWFSTRPTARIDHVFVSPSLAVESVEVPRMGLARSASDHLPVIVDLWLGAAGETPTDAREAA
ncbi:MAG: endonuclease [Rhodospirillaceae bacterium]|nr:endonuclease [Rhodospirillaceae bacterium]